MRKQDRKARLEPEKNNLENNKVKIVTKLVEKRSSQISLKNTSRSKAELSDMFFF